MVLLGRLPSRKKDKVTDDPCTRAPAGIATLGRILTPSFCCHPVHPLPSQGCILSHLSRNPVSRDFFPSMVQPCWGLHGWLQDGHFCRGGQGSQYLRHEGGLRHLPTGCSGCRGRGWRKTSVLSWPGCWALGLQREDSHAHSYSSPSRIFV